MLQLAFLNERYLIAASKIVLLKACVLRDVLDGLQNLSVRQLWRRHYATEGAVSPSGAVVLQQLRPHPGDLSLSILMR